MPPRTRTTRWLSHVPRRRGRRTPAIGVVDAGGLGPAPPSADIRAHRRAQLAADAGLLLADRLTAEEYAADDARDALLVLRTGLPPALAGATLAAARGRGERVVVDLDDDLVSEHAAERLVAHGWDPAVFATMREVVGAADQVLVSTPPLAELIAPLNPRITIVENALDPGLWLTPTRQRTPRADPDELRVLYMGSTTHGADLALLDGVAASVSARLGRPVVLEAVGVVVGAGIDGMRRVRIRQGDYPSFVAWLRTLTPRWHAAVAPLVDDEFNARKSDLKLLEYALLDLPAVASRVGPYRDRAAWATLCDNEPDAWVEALAGVLEDRDRATEQAAAARAATLRDRMLDETAVREWARLVLGSPTM